MPDMQTMLRLMNIFGGAQSPDNSNPYADAGMSFDNPMAQPQQNPFQNINFGNTDMSAQPQPPMPDIGVPPALSPMGMGPADSSGGYDVAARMAQIYHPESIASDRFNKTVDSFPAHEQPSKMRRFAGAALGALTDIGDVAGGAPNKMRGMGVYNDITGKTRRDEDVADWKTKVAPQQHAADLERMTNSNERTAAYQTVANELRAHAQEAKDKNDATNAQVRQHRADVYEFKAKNPGMKVITPKGGNIQFFNPATGETKDSGIPSGSMTELDKINLQADIKGEQIEATGAERRKTVETQGDESRKTKETVGAGTNKPASGVKGEQPTQTRVRQFNSARELVNTHPEVRDFVKLGNPGSNDFIITPPSKNFFGQSTGPTDEQYKMMKDAIYGTGAIDITQPGRTGSTPVNKPDMGTSPLTADSTKNSTKKTTKFSGKRVVVQDKKGNKFTLPIEQQELASGKGYTVIGPE